jgi:NitT/TauT family transport system substrate-binding protein
MNYIRGNGWSRREFLTNLSLAGGAALLGLQSDVAAAEPPLETTRIRLEWAGGTCQAPKYVVEELLRAEGFTDVQYVNKDAKHLNSRRLKALSSGETDFDLQFVPDLVLEVEKANPIVILAGQHVGCFELFASGRIRAVRDLKHKTVAVREVGAAEHLFLSVILSYVGIDPVKDIKWVNVPFPEAVQLLTVEKIDAVLGFPPLPQQLRAKKIGHVVLNSTTDRPWWQYFCCMLVGNREFVRRYPVATKRVIRAMMKANDVCALTPDQSAQLLVGKGDTTSYDYALQTMKEIPYARWREYDPEDTVRFYSLLLHDVGMIKSSPQKIIAQGTDWRFLKELKKELKG